MNEENSMYYYCLHLSRRINLHHLISDLSESLSNVFRQSVQSCPYEVSILLAQLISWVIQSLLSGKLEVHNSTQLSILKVLREKCEIYK